MALTDQDFSFLISLIKKRSGIHLTKDKAYLIESRLLPLTHKQKLKSIEELIQYVSRCQDEKILTEITDAMTTNESSFFRDQKPFHYLKESIIPRLLTTCPNKKKFRIWSAACSTGQEPYSLAMALLENPHCAHLEFEIKATDIAAHVLTKAKEGIYSQFEVQRGLPIALLVKYFTQKEDSWIINDKVKSMVQFDRCNLMENFNHLGKFDIVLCRNVLIYFDEPTKHQVLNNISKQMEPHAALFLGSAETIFGLEDKFSLLKDTVGIYTLK